MRLKDIAHKAGTSITTASMVLNGKSKQYNISADVTRRITQLAEENNYQPNFNARALLSKKTYLIGVTITGSLDYSFWGEILRGIEDNLTPADFHILLSSSISNSEHERQSLHFMDSKGVDGFICNPIIEGQKVCNIDLLRKINSRKPVVCLGSEVEDFSSVYNDNSTGGDLVAEYLYGQGHKKIAYIGRLWDGLDNRGAAFVSRLKDEDCDVSVYENVDAFMRNVQNFTAVFCYSDYCLMELYTRAARMNLNIPDDLSVVGYDNSKFISFLTPQPTTVHQYKKELGLSASAMLLNMLDTGKTEANKSYQPKMVIGKSVMNRDPNHARQE